MRRKAGASPARTRWIVVTMILLGGLKVAPVRVWAQVATSGSYRFTSQEVGSGGGKAGGAGSPASAISGTIGTPAAGEAAGMTLAVQAGPAPAGLVNPAANPGDVILNELAWSGSDASTADEWLELRNLTRHAVDLSGWEVTYDTGAGNVIMVRIPSGRVLAPGGFFLIANYPETGASSTLNVPPDMVDTGVFLSNTNLRVRVFAGPRSTAPVIDVAGNGGAPLAGSTGAGNHASMERIDPPSDGTLAANWRTATTSVNFDPGTSERGTPRAVNAADGNPPSAITNLTALPDGVIAGGSPTPVTGRVLLTWTAPGDDGAVGTASAYVVRYATVGATGSPELWWNQATPVATGLPAPRQAGASQQATVDGLTVETNYFWAIRAQDDGANLGPLDTRTQGGAASQAQEFPNGLRPPTNFASVGVSTDTVRFTWTDASTMEELYRITNCQDNAAYDSPANATVFLASVVANAQFGCNHFTDFFANTLGAISLKYGSSPGARIISAFSLANAPTGLVAADIQPSRVRVEWSEVDTAHPATRYAVERSSDVQQTWVTIATWTTNVTTTTFTDTTMLEGSTLAYRVRGFNGDQVATDPSDAVTVVVSRLAPAAVTDLVAQAGHLEGSVRLAWTAPGDDGTVGTAAIYLIRQSTVGAITTEAAFSSAVGTGGQEAAPTLSGTTQAMTVTGLDPGVTYYFALKTLDESGNASELSNSPGAGAAVVGSAVRVNEVAAGEPSNGDWMEIFVARAAGSLSGWTLRASTGTTSTDRLVKTFPAIAPQKGDFLVVEWKVNPPADDLVRPANGVWRLYVDSTSSSGLIATDNAVTLKDSGGTIHDFMAWGNQDGTWVAVHQAAADAAVAAGQWRRLGANTLQFDCPSSRTTGTSGVVAGQVVARNETAADEGHKGDWSYQTGQTKGVANGLSTTAPGLGTAKTSSGGSVLAGATTTLLLTYTAANPNTDTTRHVATWDIPPGWSAPQTGNAAGAGFTTTTFAFTGGFSLSVIGRTVILPVGNLANGAAVTVEYRNAQVQGSTGTATFVASADDNGTNVAALVAGSPSLSVTGGAAAPRMARQAGPGLGVPEERIVVGPNVVKGDAAVSLWFYADWPQWEAKVCLLNAAGETICEGGEDAVPPRTIVFERAAGLSGRPGGRPYADTALAPAYIHRAVWRGRNATGAPVASGVYMMVFDINNPETGETQRAIRKLVVIR